MQHRLIDEFFRDVLAMRQDTPYRSALSVGDASFDDGEAVSIPGDVIFRLEDNTLKFEFFMDGIGTINASHFNLIAESHRLGLPILLRVPESGFESEITVRSMPSSFFPVTREPLSGEVDSRHLGSKDVPLKSATAWFKGLPEVGERNLGYASGTFDISTNNDPMSLTLGELRGKTLSTSRKLTFSGGGWDVTFQEVPASRMSASGESHIASIHRTHEEEFTSIELCDLLENLNTFLAFVFGMWIRPFMCVGSAPKDDQGYRSPVWAMLGKPSIVNPSQGNWFARFSGEFDLNTLFGNYMKILEHRPEFRRYFRLLVEAYVDAELAFNELGRPGLALEASVGALEGLIKLVLTLLAPVDKQKKFMNLDEGQKIGRIKQRQLDSAVNFVLQKLTNGRKLKIDGKDAWKFIKDHRNSIAHVDLDNEIEPFDLYCCWNASQAMFEIALLSMWGAKDIPLRTSVGKYEVMGVDMLEEARWGALTLE